ncbi:MAG: amidohydrolase family protein [Pseudomonadota bacterium]
MTIIDAHHHVWRRADLPWLLGPTQPRIFGPYDPIKRDYSVAEYTADLSGTGVEKSVYVQANWAPNWFVDEARFVANLAEETGWPHAIVAYCDMTQADARADLDRLAALPLVRGIRHQMHWHEEPLYRFAGSADVVGSPAVQHNVAALSDYGFVFELQIFAGQITPALQLVDACPDVTFVLQHALMLVDTSEAGWSAWQAAMADLAARDNVVCKLSGLGTFLRHNDPGHIRAIATEAVDLFGADRCLFGSNFPIEKLWTDYGALLKAHQDALAERTTEERAAIFHTTAERIYRLA